MTAFALRSLLVAAGACAALTTSAAASDAPPETKPARACFFASQLSNWREVDDHTVNLRVGVRDFYQLKLHTPCPDLKYAEALGIETTAGSDSICSGLDVTLIVPRGAPRRCLGTGLRKMTAEEAAALPRGHRP